MLAIGGKSHRQAWSKVINSNNFCQFQYLYAFKVPSGEHSLYQCTSEMLRFFFCRDTLKCVLLDFLSLLVPLMDANSKSMVGFLEMVGFSFL